MNLFEWLETILQTSDIPTRFGLFEQGYQDFKHQPLAHTAQWQITPIQEPIYANICKILHPTKISRDKQLKSDQSMARFLHSIAHIEYSAFDLALDASYRFRHLPRTYYEHWLEVANEEKRHFTLLNQHLEALGYTYGDFPVHTHLFDAMKHTPLFADRMAVVHRGLEAGGLDANPFVCQKVLSSLHPLSPKILETLHIILNDEISHVQKGDIWWKYSNDSRSFVEILRQHHYPPPKILNQEARLRCGFSQEELEALQNFHKESIC
ncbi:hypothetical protein BBW65_06585 [Helicobacter enhydrae]|uniref:Ferritin-like domain-containing protein n=1 Tax=Helicobacter enhydrae TaxID=222136 RepID=A0A1B1U6R1_9HELI|nr:ferritin-like domain-containing protein [Helicobacter enhydrae]ANV98484.1 hypothetical protein BBW65_06585 [Helicobacter enhydrae]